MATRPFVSYGFGEVELRRTFAIKRRRCSRRGADLDLRTPSGRVLPF